MVAIVSTVAYLGLDARGVEVQVQLIAGLPAFNLVGDGLRPLAFGASAADLESDIVYSILLANPAMSDTLALFHATHGNLGTAADVTEASLSEAYRMFAQQKGLEGRLISILPRFILVPPGKRSLAARKQVASVTAGNTSEVNTSPAASR